MECRTFPLTLTLRGTFVYTPASPPAPQMIKMSRAVILSHVATRQARHAPTTPIQIESDLQATSCPPVSTNYRKNLAGPSRGLLYAGRQVPDI